MKQLFSRPSQRARSLPVPLMRSATRLIHRTQSPQVPSAVQPSSMRLVRNGAASTSARRASLANSASMDATVM